jgi:hypothetical protein
MVAPTSRRDVADAPLFDVIARKFQVEPRVLAFAILDPHPRINVALTHREAEDIASYDGLGCERLASTLIHDLGPRPRARFPSPALP